MPQKFWGILFGVVLAGILVFTVVSPWLGWWLPPNISSYGGSIDKLFYLILGVTTFFFVLTEALLVYNMLTFIGPDRKVEFSHGSVKLEALWTIIPAVILVALGLWQISVWADIKYPSRLVEKMAAGDDYLQISMAARQWEYRMRYPSPERIANWDRDRKSAVDDFKGRLPERMDDIHVVNDLHVVKGQKALVFLHTRDVGHSLFLPNVRVKQDALPGRTIPVWFQCEVANVTREGDKWVDSPTYDLVCTQYCGSRHSMMRGKLYVHPDKADFLAWLTQAHNENSQHSGPTQGLKAAMK